MIQNIAAHLWIKTFINLIYILLLMKEALSYKGNRIRLTEERWVHITSSHPEMVFLVDEVLDTIEHPDKVLMVILENQYL